LQPFLEGPGVTNDNSPGGVSLNSVGRWGSDSGVSLLDLYDRMIGPVHIPTVLQQVAQVVCESLGAERALVFLVEPATRELESAPVIGNVTRTFRVPIDKSSLAGHCVAAHKAFVVADAYGDLSAIDPQMKFNRRWDELNDFRTRDVMCAPAEFKGDVMGVVQVINSRGRPFSSDDLPALCTIARLIGYALYHARLYDDLATLKKLETEKAGFMRLLAHELKSPLATSKMLLSALEDGDDRDDAAVHVTSRMAASLDEMIAMIGDLLVLAKVKSGEAMGEVAPLDLVAETTEGCRRHRDQADVKGLSLGSTCRTMPSACGWTGRATSSCCPTCCPTPSSIRRPGPSACRSPTTPTGLSSP